jgi:elongation factor G
MPIASVKVEGIRITLLDPGGGADVRRAAMDARSALRGADAVVFVISAVSGLDVATRLLWQECESRDVPRVIVLTHVDAADVDVAEIVGMIGPELGEGVGILPLHLTMFDDDDRVAGLIDLVRLRVADHTSGARVVRDAEDEHRELVEGDRTEIIEGIMAESDDDALMSSFLDGEDLDDDVLTRELFAAVGRGRLHPVLVTAAIPSGLGVAEIAEMLAHGFPSPLQANLPMVTAPDGEPRDPLVCSPDGPFCAEVLGLLSGLHGERLTVLRMFSGRLRNDSPVVVSHRSSDDRDEAAHVTHGRVDSILTGAALSLESTECAAAGDVVVVSGLEDVHIGDTLSSPENPLLVDAPAPPMTILAEPLAPVLRDHPHLALLPLITIRSTSAD